MPAALIRYVKRKLLPVLDASKDDNWLKDKVDAAMDAKRQAKVEARQTKRALKKRRLAQEQEEEESQDEEDNTSDLTHSALGEIHAEGLNGDMLIPESGVEDN